MIVYLYNVKGIYFICMVYMYGKVIYENKKIKMYDCNIVKYSNCNMLNDKYIFKYIG